MANVVRRGELYPVATEERTEAINAQTRVEWTGEKRPPRKGEWFLSGALVEGYRARADMTQPYHIGALVEGELVWVRKG